MAVAGCFDPAGSAVASLAPEARTALRGVATATTARWAPVLNAEAEWRTAPGDRRLVGAQPLLRFRDPDGATVFAFWATYCPPCFQELPLLKRLHARPEVSVVSVSLDADQTDLAATALAHHDVQHRTLVLTKESLPGVGRRLPQGLPFTLVLDRDGQVAAAVSGLLDEGRLTTVLSTGQN